MPSQRPGGVPAAADFFTDAAPGDTAAGQPGQSVDVRQPSLATTLPIAVCAVITLGFGIAPQWLLNLTDAAVPFLR